MLFARTGTPLLAGLLLSFLTVFPLTAQVRVEDPDGGNTLDNLQAAYNSESNTNARYLAYAKRADEEGYGRAASLFRAAARAGQVRFEHTAMIIAELGGIPMADIKLPPIRGTKENLEAAFKNAAAASKNIYPQYIEQAKKDNVPDAIDLFDDAQQAEAAHAALYESALKDLPAWQAPKQDFHVCPVCGNIVAHLPAESCAICSTPADEFMTIQ